MLDEEYDKRIKEAADQYHPEYDDMAWKKMEQLLDKHLPQKKHRKRIFFLLPFLVASGILIFILILNTSKKETPQVTKDAVSTNKKENSAIAKTQENTLALPLHQNSKKVTHTGKGSRLTPSDKLNFIPTYSVNPNYTSSAIAEKNTRKISVEKGKGTEKQNEESETITGHEILQDKISNPAPIALNNTVIPDKKEDVINTVKPEQISNPIQFKKDDKVIKTAKEEDKKAAKKSSSTNHQFRDNLGVTISAGPDISGVYIKDAGKLTIAYGVGINYAISKKFSIRTGFYASTKIYSVDPDDYHLPAGSLASYDFLQNVNANCKVYEIPLAIAYNFKRIKNHNWFASTGLSTYLMKKESYNYFYKTPAGVPYNKNWIVNNKNRHFFSVLNLSGGYQYFFNKQFSVIAAPYAEIPLAGIGAGKVKLNSAGILFSLKVIPFLKKDK